MLIPLSSTDIATYVAEYEAYRRQQVMERGNEELRLYNGELEVDEYLSENMHLVWYGHFHRRFPTYWSLLPDAPRSEDNTLFLKEKAKVRYICQECCHIWTSLNGCVKFWAASGHLIYFYLPGADCSQCSAPEQPALWYPDEVIRVLNNLFGFLNGGKVGRDEIENQVVYRRGVSRGSSSAVADSALSLSRSSLSTRASTPHSTSETPLESSSCSIVDGGSSNSSEMEASTKPIPLLSIPFFSQDEFNKLPRRFSRCSEDSGVLGKERYQHPATRPATNGPLGA